MEQTVTEVRAVFDETILSLKVLCLVIEQAVGIEDVKTVFGADMAYLFHEHLYVEAQYDRLLSAASIAGVLQEDADKVVKLAQQVKDSFRLICRFIRRKPSPLQLFQQLSFDVLENAESLRPHRNWTKLAIPLSQYMEIAVRRLIADEAGEKNEMDPETILLHLEITHRQCQDRCARLQGELDELNRKRVERRTQAKVLMEGLHNERERLLQRVRSEQGVAKEMIDKNIGQLEKQVMETKAAVDESCKQKGAQLERDAHKHQEQEFLLLRRTRFMNVETGKIIADYDTKMITLTRKAAAAEQQIREDTKRCKEIQEEQVDVLVADRLEWEAVLAGRRRALEEQLEQLSSACTVLQRAFRSYLKRRPPKKKKGKKTKGKKKK